MSVITLALGHHAVTIMIMFLVCIKAVATYICNYSVTRICHGDSAAIRVHNNIWLVHR